MTPHANIVQKIDIFISSL